MIIEKLPPNVLKAVQEDSLIDGEEIATLTPRQILTLVPHVTESMEKEKNPFDSDGLLEAVLEYGLHNLPIEFLRLLYSHRYGR